MENFIWKSQISDVDVEKKNRFLFRKSIPSMHGTQNPIKSIN